VDLHVHSIGPDAAVHKAIKRMADRDFGSLVVIDEGSARQTCVDDMAEERVVYGG